MFNRDGDTSLSTLRNQVLDLSLRLTALGVPAVSLVLIFSLWRTGNLTSLNLALACSSLAYPALYACRTALGFTLVSRIFLGLVIASALMVQLRGGVVVSSAVLQLVAIILGALLFGRRGALLTLLVTLLGLASAAVLVTGEHVPSIPVSAWDPSRPLTWVRSGLVLSFLGGSAVLAVVFMLEQLAREAQALRDTLAREQAERGAREAAEAERERAYRALAEAHRLEALGRLAAGVAHDFNNILTVIVGTAELTRNAAEQSPETQQNLRDIEDAARRASQLTHELLMLGRKEADAPRSVNLQEHLSRFSSKLRRVLPSDIQLIIHGVDACVSIEPLRFERVLLNLVANARDAITGKGEIEIGSQLKVAGAGPGTVELWVKDNGAGMDAATQERLFEPFFTTKGAGKGSGLGMALVQRFVMDAGGEVRVEAALGAGTTVTLSLPQSLGVDVVQSAPALPAAHFTRVPRGRTILVVEDQREVRALVLKCLEREGYRVLEAADGDAALRILDDTSVAIDLLCVDGVIPGASTAQVIDRLRSLRPDTPVVVCSGYVDEELSRRGIRTGELSCVRKPFTPTELLNGVRAQLRSSVQRTEPRAAPEARST